ncbi:cyclophilin-like fold protein [Blautia sp.]|uniref:cyclophilin-like fold protein n=1 Tax=Blautia sp. TaxID=1955243 RepID=UPI003AB5EE8B
MKKRWMGITLLSALIFAFTACGNREQVSESSERNQMNTVQSEESDKTESSDSITNIETEVEEKTEGEEKQMVIEVNGQQFFTVLYENETTEALKNMLPMTLNMDELNGNEKYYYLDDSLPTDRETIGTIQNGDIMLYGSDCLVLFFDTFNTSYSYTKIGHIEDADTFADTLTNGTVEVTFRMAE